MMKAIWTDEDGDEIELTDALDGEGPSGDLLFVVVKGDPRFAFNEDDAESFAAYLRAWALKQREGV